MEWQSRGLLFTALLMAAVAGAARSEDRPDAAPAEVVRPASERYAAADAPEVPDFRRHLVPLLGRLGCNGRACHGSFQGQGGFRLSLFGYDFSADHAALLDGKRVNPKSPAESLILLKPTLTEPHKGGKRYRADGWQFHLISRWIQAGATRT